MSSAASATSMSCFSPRISTRKNSRPSSVPTNGVSSGTPAAARWRGVSDPADTVMIADALARRQHRLHPWHLDQRAGRDRHPHMRRQLRLEQRQEAAVGGDRLGAVVRPVRPRPPGSRPAGRRRRSAPRVPAWRPRTTRYSTGNGQVVALPMSPGMRGNRRLQHQDAERRAVQRLAALGDDLHAGTHALNRTTGGSDGRAAVHPG